MIRYRPCGHKRRYKLVIPCYRGWTGRNCRYNNIQIVGRKYHRNKLFCLNCFINRRAMLFRCFGYLKRRTIAKANSKRWHNLQLRLAINGLQKQFRREANSFEERCRRVNRLWTEIEVRILGDFDILD